MLTLIESLREIPAISPTTKPIAPPIPPPIPPKLIGADKSLKFSRYP